MPETNTPAGEPNTDPNASPPQGDPAGADALGEAGKKALHAERQRANAAERALKDAQALVETRDGEIANLTEAAEKFKQEAAESLVSEVRAAVIEIGGIDATDAELFLTGTTSELVRGQAKRILEKAGPNPSAPRPDPTQGGSGNPLPLNGDPIEDAVRAITARRSITCSIGSKNTAAGNSLNSPWALHLK